MYTNCPNCSKEFEIFAEHLKAANGMVRCGACHTAFNALVRLYDQPKQLDLPTLDTEPVEEVEEILDTESTAETPALEVVIDSDDVDREAKDSLKPDTIEDIEEDDEDKTLTDIDEEIIDNIDELELTIQDQITQAEFDDGEEKTDSDALETESETTPEIELDTDASEDVVSLEIDIALQEVADIPEPEATIEDHTTQDDIQLDSTMDGIEEANIEEEITLDENSAEQIRESVEQFKLLMGEDEEVVSSEEDADSLSLKNDIAKIDGDVDPELQALTDLLDEVDDYIPEPEFKITDSEDEAQTQETIEEEIQEQNQEEAFTLNLSSTNTQESEEVEAPEAEQAALSVKAEEIDVINQAINRIQQDDDQKIELPDISNDLLEPDTPPEPLPEILEEQKASTNYGMLFFWTLLAVIVLLFGTLQLAWFNRDMLLEKYPQYYPQAKQLCDQINNKGWFECKLRRYKNLSAIQIKERDVRLHPEFEKTLLINASMVNTAEHAQDFPSIQIILFGDSGEQTAQVEITPNDYLDNSIDRKLGMQSDIPVHFIVEVNGEIESANSFEFHFF